MKHLKELHEMGFALHWLYPKQKRPINKWAENMRRPTREELRAQYKPGMNVGVILGNASTFKDGSVLAAIDVDVRDPSSIEQVYSKLQELFPGYDKWPCVISGRDNGSMHIYVRLEKSVAVNLVYECPSKSFSIALYCSGRQMVLPPSIHPETGAEYKWYVFPSEKCPIPLLTNLPAKIGKKKSDKTPLKKFVPVVMDPELALPASLYETIADGKGVTDRSEALFFAMGEMIKLGFSDDEILSVFTAKHYYLGAVAYDHTQSDDISKAAHWLRKYPLAKARENFSYAKADFAAPIVEALPLDEAGAKAQIEDVKASIPWQNTLECYSIRSGGAPKNIAHNIQTILSNAISPHLVRYNSFANRIVFGTETPWGSKEGDELSESSVVNAKTWMFRNYRLEPSSDKTREAFLLIAEANAFHPIREYLNAIIWDGKPRVNQWLFKYAGAVGNQTYIEAIGRKTLCAMVARVMVPGIKFDHVLILEGKQNIGKSTLLRAIVGDSYFTDQDIDASNKDTIGAMQGKWLVEFGELAGMSRQDVRVMKAFITRTTDRARLAYEKDQRDYPRQCIFVGTTNDSSYLNDPTGSRRFWPVTVTKCAPKLMERDRDQLLAEALVLWKAGEPLWLETEELNALAMDEAEAREFEDPLKDRVRQFFEDCEKEGPEKCKFPYRRFRLVAALSDFGPFAGMHLGESFKATKVLRALGYSPKQTWENGKNVKMWSKD